MLDLDLKTGVNPLKTWPWLSHAAKSQDEKSSKGVALVFKDRWGGPVFIHYFAIFMVKTNLFNSYSIKKEWSYNFFKNL